LTDNSLASFDAAVVEDPETTWSFVFYTQSGQPKLWLQPDAPAPSRLRSLRSAADGALVPGSLSQALEGQSLLFEVDAGPGAAVAALERYLEAAGRRFRILRDEVEEEEVEAPHPYPVLRRLLAGLALASEPWSFLYVPAEGRVGRFWS